MNYLINSAALLLAAFIGFSSHRASLCMVKAVAELLSSRRGFVLASFAKATLWVAMIYGTLLFAVARDVNHQDLQTLPLYKDIPELKL